MVEIPIIESFIVHYIAFNANEIKVTKWSIDKKQNPNFPLYEMQNDANHSMKLLWHFPKISTLNSFFSNLHGTFWWKQAHILEAFYPNKHF